MLQKLIGANATNCLNYSLQELL